MRLRALAESRGATRILHVIFCVVSMAVLFGIDQTASVTLNCKPILADLDAITQEIKVSVSYPFDVFGDVNYLDCNNNGAVISDYESPGYKSHSQFYMSSIFLTFFSSILFLIIYTFKEAELLYSSLPYYKIDLGIVIFLNVYAVIGAILMSVVSTGVHNNATPEFLTNIIPECKTPKDKGFQRICTHGMTASDTDLAISTCLAWIQVVIYGGLTWFTYKEVRDGP